MQARTLSWVAIAVLAIASSLANALARNEETSWTVFRGGPANNVAIDGKLQATWKVVTGGPISSSPTLSGSTLFIGNNRGDVDAIDVTTGKIRWSRRLSNAVMSAPLLYRDIVIVGEGDEQSMGSAPGAMYVGMGPSALVALDAGNGNIRWKTAVAGSAMPTGAIVKGVLVHHNGAGWVTALNPLDGKPIYARNLHSIASMTAALPIGSDRFVTIGTFYNAAWQLNVADGSVVWKAPFPKSGSGHGDCPPVTDGRVIVCNYVGPVPGAQYTSVGSYAVQRAYALDVRTGAKVWDVALQSGLLQPRNEAAIPLLDSGVVYFGSALAPYMHALRVADGRVLWQTKLRAPVKGGIAMTNGRIYFGDLSGRLWSLEAGTGRIIGCRKMPSGFNVGSPIVVGRTMVIGSRTGSIYAVPLSTIDAGRES